MTLANLTRKDIDSAIARLLTEGVPAALARHGARAGRFVLRHGGTTKDSATDIPTKVVLAEASGMSVREFSGGFARTVGILIRHGFDVIDTRTGRSANPAHDGRTTKPTRKGS